jgi:transposase
MKAYSEDLRCLVVNAYESGEGTIDEVAEQFGVGTAFVKKMLRRHRAGESLKPRHGGGGQPLLNDEHRSWLRVAVETRPDASLRELKEFLAVECRITVSEPTLCRELQKLKLPRKKRVSFRASEIKAGAGRSAEKLHR